MCGVWMETKKHRKDFGQIHQPQSVIQCVGWWPQLYFWGLQGGHYKTNCRSFLCMKPFAFWGGGYSKALSLESAFIYPERTSHCFIFSDFYGELTEGIIRFFAFLLLFFSLNRRKMTNQKGQLNFFFVLRKIF